MSDPIETYTYRNGKKVQLVKSNEQFVVAALPADLNREGFARVEQVSATSSRVTTTSDELEREMARARFIAPTHHVYRLADSGQDFLPTDQVFVTFREGVDQSQIDEFMGRYALLPVKKYSEKEFLFRLTNHTGMNPVKLVRKLTEEEAIVALVDHNLGYRMQKYQFQLPSDPGYGYQWHLHTHFAHPEVDTRAASMCEGAWQALASFGNNEVVIGITDDGCQLSHFDFDSSGKFAGWAYWEFASPTSVRFVKNTDPGADPTRMYEYGQNHGTSCAGVAAAEVDAVLTVGVAPTCCLLPVKWPSDGPSLLFDDNMLDETLQWMGDKVDIVSNSWGRPVDNIYATRVVNTIKRLATSGGRRGRGIVFLWAAGNENCPINLQASIPVPYSNGWKNDVYPEWVGVDTAVEFSSNLVDIPEVLHVAALTSTAQRSHYSNYGPGIDICAPSSNSHTYRRGYVSGLRILTTTGSSEPYPLDFFGGTSSATPLVAGVAALVISANPDLTGTEVVSILKRTASKDLSFQGYPRTAPANYDPNPVWDVSPVPPFDKGDFQDIGDPDGTWSPWFGHGRVDAEAAVAEALRLRVPTNDRAQTAAMMGSSGRRRRSSNKSTAQPKKS